MSDAPTRIHRIIHKHVHDVRNLINGLDLMAEMVDSLCTDPALARPLLDPLQNATRRIAWSPSSASGTLTVDVEAILSVLRQLVTAGWYRSAGGTLQAAVRGTGTGVVAEVRESQPKTVPEVDSMDEARRLVEINGGTLDISEEKVSGDRVISLGFGLGG